MKAILENPKAAQNTLFRRFVINVLFTNDLFVATLHFSSKWLQWLMAG